MFRKIILTAFIILLLDQISKFIFIRYFNFTVNTGGLFGVLNSYNSLLIVLSLTVMGFLLFYRREFKNYFGVGFVVGGILGNLVDRVFRGGVIDFIDLKIWPSFNIADFFISLGVIILIYYLIKKS